MPLFSYRFNIRLFFKENFQQIFFLLLVTNFGPGIGSGSKLNVFGSTTLGIGAFNIIPIQITIQYNPCSPFSSGPFRAGWNCVFWQAGNVLPPRTGNDSGKFVEWLVPLPLPRFEAVGTQPPPPLSYLESLTPSFCVFIQYFTQEFSILLQRFPRERFPSAWYIGFFAVFVEN